MKYDDWKGEHRLMKPPPTRKEIGELIVKAFEEAKNQSGQVPVTYVSPAFYRYLTEIDTK